jgi:hypothetical protein
VEGDEVDIERFMVQGSGFRVLVPVETAEP